ncbi:amiloride-sensitive sodium channel subunit gamma-like [Protopterus annectens]|uniref:amiloride-sensitive sodium channel subunit gamma-like n=1 Tax=Protopterus annectens TaxID=7888 RepID=UPI001CFA8C3A|nr:amiloride-sensitive sodium channel subunit gamma-like [Protopterus annectens]
MKYWKNPSLQKICRETLAHTTAHGIPSILRSQTRLKRTFWLIFVALVLICLLWQCTELIAKFFRYPSQEKITLVNMAKLNFPAVTFCNLNRVRASILNSKYKYLRELLPSSLESMANESSRKTHKSGNQNEQKNFHLALSMLSEEQQLEIGHQLDDMLFFCSFHGGQCNKSFFTTFLNHKFGNCFTFNGLNMGADGESQWKEILNATKAGFSYGLMLELYIEQVEYIKELSSTAGLRMVIHDQHRMPFPEDEGVNISPGMESDIGMVKIHVRRLKPPYSSKCTDGEEKINYYATTYDVGYSREACKKSCGQMKLIKNCGCRVSEFPAPPRSNAPFCNISDKAINNCVEQYEYKIAHDELKCNCPLQCEEENFELTLSSSQWPSRVTMEEFSKKLKRAGGKWAQAAKRVRDNLIKVVVYYQQLNYELIEEIPSVRAVDLISSIGGLVGLWIGVSVCTVAEFIELCINILLFSIRRLLHREKHIPLNPYTLPNTVFRSQL